MASLDTFLHPFLQKREFQNLLHTLSLFPDDVTGVLVPGMANIFFGGPRILFIDSS